MASLALPAIGVGLALQERAAPAETAEVSHQVVAGETLSAIAARYGVSVSDLVRANGLSNPDVIFAGQTLIIPRLIGTSGESVHIVQAGESLSVIALRYGITAQQIAQANSITDINRIYAGQHLLIPSGGGAVSGATSAATSGTESAAATTSVASAAAASSITHTVRLGDTLYRISLIYGVPVDEIIAANSLSDPNALTVGQGLRIPSATDTAAQTYVVRSGETLAEIAVRYNTTVDGIATASGISDPSRIYPGQVLNIPSPGAVARDYPAESATSHTVGQGETMGQIALRYGVTVSALAAANGITNSSRIYTGQVLSIPSASAGSASVRYASYGAGLCINVEVEHSGSGYFIRPMRGYVISQYFHPWHSGIDLAIPAGSKVYAADGGTVIYAGWNPAGYGNLIVLDHGNGWRTYYAHLSQINVECGEWVPRGSIIAASGNTGNSTGPHLHFEMLRYGVPVNPAGYLGF
jgi:murein DD-endopeptidase MepM/ murein hydrolase activator NlpD